MSRGVLVLVFASLGTFTAVMSAPATSESDYSPPTVTIRDGKVRGMRSDMDGRSIETYYGIPYATPPLGNLRFKAPQPPEPWTGVRDGTVPSRICPQISDLKYMDLSPQSEDCLYINVFTPTERREPLPVMFWIHGGAFRCGQGAVYDGRRLASKDIVHVNFNYRLDVLGFLSTEDDVMPGNYGMLDQVAALKWVRDNIAFFGGNPNQVTIAGMSAGSASVSLHLLSPLSKGLFHGAIMESGTSLSPGAWAQPARTVSPGLATKLIGAQVGCVSKISAELLECFRKVDVSLLLEVSRHLRLLVTGWSAPILMAPRVEQTYGFLPDIPLRLWLNGSFHHVSTIRGFSEHELAYFFNFTEKGQSASAETFKNLAVKEILSQYTLIDKDKLIEKITDVYLDNITDNDPLAYAQAELEFGSDFIFVEATLNEIKIASQTSTGEKHYLYQNLIRPPHSQQPDWVTATHADEVLYVFGLVMDFTDPVHGNAMETFMSLWTNFIKTGDPNTNSADGTAGSPSQVTWTPFAEDRQNILHITEEGVDLQQYEKYWATQAYFDLLQKTDTAYLD